MGGAAAETDATTARVMNYRANGFDRKRSSPARAQLVGIILLYNMYRILNNYFGSWKNENICFGPVVLQISCLGFH